MNKKFVFYIYAAATSLLIILARENWTLYLSAKKLWQLNFAWLPRPFIFSLLSANMLFFDCMSIWLPRSDFNSLSRLMVIRQPSFKSLVINIAPRIWQYLLVFMLVHIFAFSNSNLVSSLIVLVMMVVIWLILMFWPNYQRALSIQGAVIFILLLAIRLFLYQFI
ncbi:hypothetical protein OZY43_05860 [Lactobacillus sp. ESL0785]|uniref:hypothetical protein n=1 Tax=Lactobacillus sp. ESL0785 TaxID=2983232 RepID=UPI0023F6F317|nr:hypothetical protein [Lactobacillus sp. ESL0785]WEV70467.1 hypothetical protein OZY43_05860 [Lactobacillus sp. ESL0785]